MQPGDKMETYDHEVVNLVLDISNRNSKEIQHMAWLAINKFGRDAAKVVIYCIKYSEVLQGLIQELGPDTDKEVKSFQRQGQEPIFIGILETDIFDEFMSRVRPRIKLPKCHLDSDKVRLLVLCERGFIWQQTTPIVNAMSLS